VRISGSFFSLEWLVVRNHPPSVARQERLLARRPFHIAAANEVDVHVEDGLAGFGPDIEHGSVAVFNTALAADLGGHQMESADHFGVFVMGFLQASDVCLRNDQNVCGRLRIDVFEGDCMRVFVNLLGGDFALDDSAEETVSHRK
jgi:hypothetical protein